MRSAAVDDHVVVVCAVARDWTGKAIMGHVDSTDGAIVAHVARS